MPVLLQRHAHAHHTDDHAALGLLLVRIRQDAHNQEHSCHVITVAVFSILLQDKEDICIHVHCDGLVQETLA